MNNTISRLRAMGYEVQLEDKEVVCRWKGTGRPDPATVRPLMNELKERKAEILDVLRAEAEDFDERAGIIEYDGGLPRHEAEKLALKCIFHPGVC